MEPTDKQLIQLKEIELNIFKEFIRVCDALKLNYYLLDGSLLGAVRHQGFIPWDDDIDVGMLREDYEIFLEKAQNLLPKELFLQTHITDPEYPANFAKIRNSDTTFIESSVSDFKINHGVYIDIFPLDYYPDDKSAQRRIDLKLKFYNRRIACNFKIKGKSTLKRKLISFLMRVRYPSFKTTLQKREKLYRSTKQSSKIANFSSAWGKREIVPLDWYGDGAILNFEGLPVTVPKNYTDWLTQVYGDYMELPPLEKRQGHHYTDVIDLETPYTKYTEKQS